MFQNSHRYIVPATKKSASSIVMFGFVLWLFDFLLSIINSNRGITGNVSQKEKLTMQTYTDEQCNALCNAILLAVETKKHGGWVRYIQRIHPEYIDFLNWKYPQLSGRKLSTKIHWLKYGIVDFPECPTCHKKYGQNIDVAVDDEYMGHCSCRCAQLDKRVRDKNAATNLKRYGVANPAQSKQAQEKMKRSCLEKYGVDNIFKSEKFKHDMVQTNMEKYGVKNPHQRLEVIKKTKQTNLKKYGSVIPSGFHAENVSKGENELYQICSNLYHGKIIQNDRETLGGLELDIWFPELKLGIEYDGDFWHNLPDMIERDKLKDRLCKEHGILLIRVKEHDYVAHKQQIITQLKFLLEDDKLC